MLMETTKGAACLFGYGVKLSHLSEDDGGGWLAEVPELEGCISTGESPQQALANVQDAIGCWLESAREHGKQIPPPMDHIEPEFSGKFTLRMPRALHRLLARQAEREGVSLNQYVVSLVSFNMGRELGEHQKVVRGLPNDSKSKLTAYMMTVKAEGDDLLSGPGGEEGDWDSGQIMMSVIRALRRDISGSTGYSRNRSSDRS